LALQSGYCLGLGLATRLDWVEDDDMMMMFMITMIMILRSFEEELDGIKG